MSRRSADPKRGARAVHPIDNGRIIGYLKGVKPIRQTLLTLLLLLSLCGCGMKSFIFFPEKEIHLTPADAGLTYEEIYLDTADGVQINGWFLPAPGARTTLLWLHGNGGNMSYVVSRIHRFLPRLKCNIFIIDYRGYGRSEGDVSEEGTYRDALAAYDYLRTRADVDPARIVPLGVSLGAGVALELALQRPVQALILEAPFASIREMARVVAPWVPIGPLLTTRYDNIGKIGRLSVPLLILHGDRDEVVPFEQGRKLFTAAREPKRFYTIPGAGHNDTDAVGGPLYFAQMAEFIAAFPPAPDRTIQ